ncbi:MAG TPA: ABC transporter permease subunit [Thermoprotei archaeon]|nr:ABC transporter permease subunit [Thermoprotei archaeon]
MAIAIPPSFYIVRSRGRIKNIFLIYMMIPFVIPWIIIGISSYIFYWYIGLPKSLLTAALSHIVYSIPLIVTLLAPRLYTLDPDIENASMDLGADPIQTFRYIILPQILPAMLSAAVITFAWSFDNFIVSYYTLGDELTWPVWVFSILGKVPRIMPIINAISVVIITVSTLILYVIVKKGFIRLI